MLKIVNYKILKIFIFSLCVISAKLYTLNLIVKSKNKKIIFQANVFFDNYDNKKTKDLDIQFQKIVLIDQLNNSIKNKEATIASVSLFNSLIHTKYYVKTLKKLFSNEKTNWNIFGTKDKNFIIFIPHSKYPKTKKLKNLEIIGLNIDKICTIRSYNKQVIIKNLKKLLEETKNYEKLDINYLSRFFLNKELILDVESSIQ